MTRLSETRLCLRRIRFKHLGFNMTTFHSAIDRPTHYHSPNAPRPTYDIRAGGPSTGLLWLAVHRMVGYVLFAWCSFHRSLLLYCLDDHVKYLYFTNMCGARYESQGQKHSALVHGRPQTMLAVHLQNSICWEQANDTQRRVKVGTIEIDTKLT